MASDLKLDQVMTASNRGRNVHLMGNPAVLLHTLMLMYLVSGALQILAAAAVSAVKQSEVVWIILKQLTRSEFCM